MKRILLTAAILLSFSVCAFADAVSLSEAEKAAKTYMNAGEVTLAYSDDACYAFNNPAGGWVMISAENCAEPILGHNETGSFDAANIPGNFRVWTSLVGKNFRAVRKAGMKPRTEVSQRWASPARQATKASGAVQIETAAWNQSSPYNNYCPKSSLTGCVATAMAIFLRSQQWPDQGKGTIPAYTTETKSYSVDAININGYAYNWSDMPLTDGASVSWTSAQKEAVARLMQHCGAMVEMDYTTSGSGAYSEYIIPALAEFMSYSASAREEYRVDFNNYEWFSMIKSEIDAGRPLLYGGSDEDTEDGHQFICDGYNSNYEIHINWGWGGYCNGWYAVNYLGDKGGNVDDVFSYYDTAIFGLVPDAEGSDPDNVSLCLMQDGDYYGLYLEDGDPLDAGGFEVSIGYIFNYYDVAFNGKVKLVLCDKDGAVKETVGDEKSISIKAATSSMAYSTAISSYTAKITSSPQFGDYVCVYYQAPSGEWRYMGGEGAQTKIGVYDFPYILLPQDCKAGDVIYFEYIPGWDTPSSVAWYYDGNSNTSGNATLTSGKHTVKAVLTYTSGRKATIQRVIDAQ